MGKNKEEKKEKKEKKTSTPKEKKPKAKGFVELMKSVKIVPKKWSKVAKIIKVRNANLWMEKVEGDLLQWSGFIERKFKDESSLGSCVTDGSVTNKEVAARLKMELFKQTTCLKNAFEKSRKEINKIIEAIDAVENKN